MRNLCMTVSYDGTAYNGFQSQPHHNTIQDKMQEAIRVLTGAKVKITGSGRTDAGVHARKQVFNFYTDSAIPIERWPIALNSRLPEDIVVGSCKEVPSEFHARHCASRKTYRYTIYCAKRPDLFARHMQIFLPKRLDINRMKEALHVVVGEHDFSSFCAADDGAEHHVRTILSASLECVEYQQPPESEKIYITITGTGFLYHMVRNIAGTLIEVGQRKRTVDDMQRILESCERKQAGPTAPAKGLMLYDVEYDQYDIE